jgi:L-asparagine transporter-like permease
MIPSYDAFAHMRRSTIFKFFFLVLFLCICVYVCVCVFLCVCLYFITFVGYHLQKIWERMYIKEYLFYYLFLIKFRWLSERITISNETFRMRSKSWLIIITIVFFVVVVVVVVMNKRHLNSKQQKKRPNFDCIC